jgi:RES domain-containing protein
MVYTSESRSLAALEILVHLQGSAIGFSLIACEIPDSTPIEDILESKLPNDWRAQPASPELARLGDEWIVQGRSVALRVPSAVVDGEHNILLNPAHPDFKMLRIHAAVPFPYDPRLVELTGNR